MFPTPEMILYLYKAFSTKTSFSETAIFPSRDLLKIPSWQVALCEVRWNVTSRFFPAKLGLVSRVFRPT